MPQFTSKGIEPADLDTARRSLDKTKISLMGRTNSVFISTVAFSMQHIFTRQISTAATDGSCIYYNPDFMASLSPDVRLFVLLHETWHVALRHCVLMSNSRQQKRHPQLFNIAADYVINLLLLQSGYKLWKHALLDYQYDNMTTEQVYNKLLNDAEQDEKIKLSYYLSIPDESGDDNSDDNSDDSSADTSNDGSESGKQTGDREGKNLFVTLDELEELEGALTGDILDAQAPTGKDSKADQKNAEESLERILIKAAMQAKMAGNDSGSLPGEIGVYIDSLVNPKMNWRQELEQYFSDRIKTDYSFQKPNRRHAPRHYLPSVKTEQAGKVALAVDMSGSVTDEQTQQFISDAASVLTSCPINELTLIQWDVEVFSETPVHCVQDLLSIDYSGRGGTDVDPTIAWADDKDIDVLCIFTDGHFYEPRNRPAVPVVWVVHNYPQFTAPFGHVLHYTL